MYILNKSTLPHKNKLESTQLKSFLPHSGFATWRRIIYTNSIPITLHKFGK